MHRAVSHRILNILGWGWVVAIVWLSLTPSPVEINIEQGDKLGHFAAYGLLMFWFGMLYRRALTRLAYAIGFCGMGIALEYAQRMTGYRTFDVDDMLANAIGVLLGFMVATALQHRFKWTITA